MPADRKCLQKRMAAAALALILLLGFYLRFPHLDRESLWGDEINLTETAILPTLEETKAAVQIPHSYGYPGFLHFWMKGGTGEAFLRFPSLVAGLVAIGLLYVLIARFEGSRVALLAAFFLAVSHAQIRFSREVAAYSPQNAVLLAAAFFFFMALEKGNWFYWIGYALLASVSHYLHPLASTTLLGWFGLVPFLWWTGARTRSESIVIAPKTLSLLKWGVALGLFLLLIYSQMQRNWQGAQMNTGTAPESPSFLAYWQELEKLLGGHWWPFLPLVALGTAYLFYQSTFLGLTFFGWVLGTTAIWIAFYRSQSSHFDYHYFLSHLPAFMALSAFGLEGLLRAVQRGLERVGITSRAWMTPAALLIAMAIGFSQWPAVQKELDRKWPDYRAAGQVLTYRLNPEDRFYIKPDSWMNNKIRYYAREVLDRETSLDIFFRKDLQESLTASRGTLYVLTARSFADKSKYRSLVYRGVVLTWKDPLAPSPLDFEELYTQMQGASGKGGAMDLLNEAVQLKDAGQLEAACSVVIRAASEAPHHPIILRRKAEILTLAGRREEAAQAFEETYARIEEKEKWYMLAGKATNLSALGRHEEALATLDRAFQESNHYAPYLHELRAREWIALDKVDRAIQSYEASLAAFGAERPEPLLGLAAIAAKAGEKEKALEYYRRGAKVLPEPQRAKVHKQIENLEKELGK